MPLSGCDIVTNMSHYELGQKLVLRDPTSSFILESRCDDIARLVNSGGDPLENLPHPILFWVNPPFSDGSLLRFQRRAARSTVGIKATQSVEIRNSILSLYNKELDYIIWANSENGAFHIYRDKKIQIYQHLPESINKNTRSTWTDNLKTNFNNFIGEKNAPMFRSIIDPCADNVFFWFTLCQKYKINFRGICLSSLDAFSITKYIGKFQKMSIEYPVPSVFSSNGEVEGAPVIYKEASEIRNFSLGRRMKPRKLR